jgi:CheY-like chemotaxis protein
VKFTDEGAVTLHCEKLPGRDELRFRIVDTGVGIEKEAQEKLFGDFVQADASISRKHQGTGLGLSICKRLLELMGGQIGIESAPGKGSTFWFTLPYEALPDDVEIIDHLSIKSRKYRGARALSILVAEDNEINQTIIKAILDQMGHDATFANNGAEAVEIVKSQDFDLILMDVRMPELSGPDATKQIRMLSGFKGQIPIIALTADVMADNRKSYFEAGMNDLVAKPIDTEELALAINKAAGEAVNMVDDA